jgi:hypothetical protein
MLVKKIAFEYRRNGNKCLPSDGIKVVSTLEPFKQIKIVISDEICPKDCNLSNLRAFHSSNVFRFTYLIEVNMCMK